AADNNRFPSGGPTMTTAAHLWAIGYDDMKRADQVPEEIISLGGDSGQTGRALILLDIARIVRRPDGAFTFCHKSFAGVTNILGLTTVGFLAGLVLAAPLAGAAIGARIGGIGTGASAAKVGIRAEFVHEVEGLMKPGTSALFILDDQGD